MPRPGPPRGAFSVLRWRGVGVGETRDARHTRLARGAVHPSGHAMSDVDKRDARLTAPAEGCCRRDCRVVFGVWAGRAGVGRSRLAARFVSRDRVARRRARLPDVLGRLDVCEMNAER